MTNDLAPNTTLALHAYRQGDYRGALDLIHKANLPGHWGMHAGIAAAAGQLGQGEAASKAVRKLLKLKPDFSTTVQTLSRSGLILSLRSVN